MSEVFVYILAGLWSAGCFGLPLWAAYWAYFEEGSNAAAAAAILILWPLCCVMAAAPWVVLNNYQSEDLAILKKNAWVCTASHQQTSTTYVKSGSVLVPVTTRTTVCDQYNRSQP